MKWQILAESAAPRSFLLRPFVPRPLALRIIERAAILALSVLLAVFAQQASQAQAYPGYAPQYQPQYQQPYPPQQYAQQPQYAAQPQYNDPQQVYADPGYDPGQGDVPQAYGQPQQAAQPFVAQQLEQLVAPIALYPDALVAQVLAGSTYPAQVVAADNWDHSLGYASPEQVAYGADAQTNWDPSVKALTAFPQVLDMMNHDLRWTTDLGNAYYNQPQDVLQTIQVMRQRAEDAGTLQSSPQEEVSYSQGYIQLAPMNPQVVYVPAYNPWTAYGEPVSPYPGFSFSGVLGVIGSVLGNGMRFGAGIGMAAFSHTPFGWAGWVLNWLASNILFHQSPYYSHSTTVAHWGNPHGGYGGQGGSIVNRFPRPEQSYNRPGNSYVQGNGYAHGNEYARGNEYGRQNGYAAQGFTRPPVRTAENHAYNRAAEAPGRGYASGYQRYVHPAQQNGAYARPEQPARAQSYVRPGDYGNGYYGGSTQAYAVRPAAPYAGQQAWRAPASGYQRNDYAQRSYMEQRSYPAQRSYQEQRSYGGGSRGFAESGPKQPGGFHMFGGSRGDERYHAPKAMKAPKAPKMSGGGHHGGGMFSHHSH